MRIVAKFSILITLCLFVASNVFANAVGARIGSGPSISWTVTGQDGIYVMQKSSYMPDGTLGLNGLVVKKSNLGDWVEVEVIKFKDGNGTTSFISIDDLGKIPAGRNEFKYSILNVNTLILIKETDSKISIVTDLNGNYDILNKKTDTREIDESKYKLINAIRRSNGLIEISK